MKARPLQAIKVYVFLHELQPTCQQLIPWVTRSKPPYSLTFGKDNTHLLRCKGFFCRWRSRLNLPRRASDGSRGCSLIRNNRKENQVKPAGEKTPQTTWESRGAAASRSDQRPDLSRPRYSHSAARPTARRRLFASASAQPARTGRASQTDKTPHPRALRPEI